MRFPFRYPIRFKILVTLLFLITTVVSLITFTMANLLHADKTAYIHDLTSMMALHIAEETRAQLTGYNDKLQAFAGLMNDPNLERQQKTERLRRLFSDFHEFVAVTLAYGTPRQTTVYDAETLERAGLSRADLALFDEEHPLPMETILNGEIYIRNSTITDTLPTLTIGIADSPPGGAAPEVVVALIELDGLLKLAGRTRAFETFLIDADGALLAHGDIDRVIRRDRVEGLPDLTGTLTNQAVGKTLEYVVGGEEVVGGFAAVGVSGLIAGVQIPKSAAFFTARALLSNLIGLALGLLVVVAILGLLWARRLTRPIEWLSNAAKEVGKGQFDIQVDQATNDEIGYLTTSFKHMADELKSREEALQTAQVQLVQSEKMAAFGQLGAGIAHEVKNPLAGILGYAQLSLRKIDSDNPLRKNLEVIEKETKRCRGIIDNLMKFARQDKVVYEPTDLNQVAQDACAIVEHQLTMNQVRLHKELEPALPWIMGNSNQIQQVLMNFMINAQQAMEGASGSVTVSTRKVDADHVQITVRDTGPGIPSEILGKIFEPFFTTKPAGKGTGLGLSVTYGIITEHKGDIDVQSQIGSGTSFVVTLPIVTSDRSPRPNEVSTAPEPEATA